MAVEGVRTILLAGAIDRTQLLAAVHLGVRGLVLKDITTELLFEAIVCVMAGRYWLEQTLVTDLLEPCGRSSSRRRRRRASWRTDSRRASVRC